MNIIAIALASASIVTPFTAMAQSAVPVTAQPSLVAPIVAVARPLATDAQAALPANTEIWVSPNAEVNSKRIKQGDKFDMTVSRDVMLGNYVVIPRGTRAIGQISYRTGKGSFGKSGKMEFEVVDVDLGGRLIPVKGHYRIEGNGNTGATVGVFAAFVTGHSALIAQGTEYKAYTTDAVPIVTASAPTYVMVAPAPPATAAAPAVVPAVVAPIAPPAVITAAGPAVVPAVVTPTAPPAVITKVSSPPQKHFDVVLLRRLLKSVERSSGPD